MAQPAQRNAGAILAGGERELGEFAGPKRIYRRQSAQQIRRAFGGRQGRPVGGEGGGGARGQPRGAQPGEHLGDRGALVAPADGGERCGGAAEGAVAPQRGGRRQVQLREPNPALQGVDDLEEPARRRRGGGLGQLRPNPFAGKGGQFSAHGRHQPQGFLGDPKARQLSGETRHPENAQRILGESRRHMAQHAGRQIRLAAVGIDEPVAILGDGVDGEVPAGQILL